VRVRHYERDLLLCQHRDVATAISDEHAALAAAVARWTEERGVLGLARDLLDADGEPLPGYWDELAQLGWLTLHLDYGMPEAALVLEGLGRACAPGPILPTVLATTVLAETGRTDLIEGLGPAGVGAVAICEDAPVLGAGLADLVVLPWEGAWYALHREQLVIEPQASLDPTRRVAAVRPASASPPTDRRLDLRPERVGQLASVVFAAEAVGLMDWCVDSASSYAKVREQFGRPIGQFQAVKHRCADMLCSLELVRAAAWDAAASATDGDEGAYAPTAAAVLFADAAVASAQDCIQVLGGIGFTWEHDAHLFLKRALSVRQLIGPATKRRSAMTALALTGARRSLRVELPPEAEQFREGAVRVAGEAKAVKGADRRKVLADSGYLVPHWPAPWGRDAGPLEQLVIDEELSAARVPRPHLQVGAWVLPTLIAHGTAEQQERFIPPTLRGEISWCQLFSEPGAGSDLAGLSTKATRTDGGWLLTGQKVWTSMARDARWGICLARTNRDAPKHDGITCFLVEMSTEGLDIRPLRELTGMAMFNEVFLEDVFVPDACVVGDVDHGWSVSRTTLANERVSMGQGSSMGPGLEALLELCGDDPLSDVGALLAEGHALAVMGLRATLRSLTGAEPGPESSVRKLLGVLHDQAVQDVGFQLLGPSGVVVDQQSSAWVTGLLFSRSLTIAGGTSEIQRNVIAERLLGLPKDP
jgi:alkylation response protein AidB-like acyl-CoA dehydrogenase